MSLLQFRGGETGVCQSLSTAEVLWGKEAQALNKSSSTESFERADQNFRGNKQSPRVIFMPVPGWDSSGD